MKLWKKSIDINAQVEKFTIGNDQQMDLFLAKADVLGSLAHTQMLETINLLTAKELEVVQKGLKTIYKEIEAGRFVMEEGMEDVHSQIEFQLTKMVGNAGAKIHSGRSRNDQVLVDLKIFLRRELYEIIELVKPFFNLLQELSDRHKEVLIPGYTHLQVAMPSSVGLWLGAFAESLVDDCQLLLSAYKICNKNPLGSAAGYGSSFPLNRTLTTELLGFDALNYNVIYAQMGRGKCEKITAMALANLASTLARFAHDNCLFMSQNFGFIKYPDEFTTGSSIMPHKKNPDVWELVRGKCNTIQALPNTISMLTNNLPLGYNRDLQLLKESLFPALQQMKEILKMSTVMLQEIIVNKEVMSDPRYLFAFSVEEVNKLVLTGVPFRTAYKKVGLEIEAGKFTPNYAVHHTHEGSIGNLCNGPIKQLFEEVLQAFDFDRFLVAEEKLIQE